MPKTPVEEGEALRQQDEDKTKFTKALERAREKQKNEGNDTPSPKR